MKAIIVFCILLTSLSARGQSDADSLTPIALEYEILDSAAIRANDPLTNITLPNVVTYEAGNEVRLAYCTHDTNRWISIPLPFSERTNNIRLFNLDQKGKPELIIKGEISAYGTGGGSGTKGIIIINIDSIPTQILKVYYGCFEESFGDKSRNGRGQYYHLYEREITITDKGIRIAKLDKKQYSREEPCLLTAIPAGLYTVEKGEIRKKKERIFPVMSKSENPVRHRSNSNNIQ